MIEITISGEGGAATTRFPLAIWQSLSPVGKVLAIHAACRHATRGRPFSIMRERTIQPERSPLGLRGPGRTRSPLGWSVPASI